MESSARLDYVLFQLTPTRTRCDLVIFAGKSNEKLAYGLLEPFIAHLRSARDQISKGGYSVTLRPPSPTAAHWFTKATLQRFVRFVSTPEVLERFVTIEREISQLQNSIKSYEASNADGETEGNAVGGNAKNAAGSLKSYEGGDEPEENSKARLHRVVETRKAVLRKEQAMVYARALAAGYEMDNLHDLLLFSDAFGASRLREACINFSDLCKKKNEDRHWVDEVSAMQAMMQPDLSYMGTSGIILAGEENDPSQNLNHNGSIDTNGNSDANQAGQIPVQMQNPWGNQFPPYLRNFQGPMYQQMPPYQGYSFPGMQGAPPYYPGNMPWPSDVNGSTDRETHGHRKGKSSSKKKGKASKTRDSEDKEHDGSTEPSESSSESETDSSTERSERKKHGKKSSRKVVIRNINYISSKRDGEKNDASESDSTDEDGYLDGDSLKQQLEEAVGSFEKHQKSSSRHHKKRNGSKHLNSVRSSAGPDDEVVSLKNKNGNEEWGALQDLLLKEDSDSNVPKSSSVPVEGDYFAATMSEEHNSYTFKPEAEGRITQKPVANDAFLMSNSGMPNYGGPDKISDESFKHSQNYHPVVKRGSTSEEFLFSQRSEETGSYSRVPIADDNASASVIKSHTSDDWYVSRRPDEAVNQGGNSQLKFVDGDCVASSIDQVDKKNRNAVIDDSLMIQGRIAEDYSDSQLRTDLSLGADFVEASYAEKGATEIAPQKISESAGFYEPDELYMSLNRDLEQTVPSWTPEMDYENNVSVNNLAKRSGEDASPDSTSNGKSPNSKKTVPSSRDARTRLYGGPLRKGKPDTTPSTRRSTFGSATAPKSQSEKEEERRKRMEALLIRREKRIAERSGAKPQAGNKPSKVQSSAEETKKPKPILRSSTIERLAAAKTTPKVPTAQPKKEASKANGAISNSRSQKTTGANSKKLNTNKINPSVIKAETENVKGADSSLFDVKETKATDEINATMPAGDLPSTKDLHVSSEVEDLGDIKEVQVSPSVIQKNVYVSVQMDSSDEKVGNPLETHSSVLNSKTKDDGIYKKSLCCAEVDVYENQGKCDTELSIHPLPESPTKNLDSPSTVEVKNITNVITPGSSEISLVEESTPGTILESTQSRKKWDGPENSPKSAKGFRKLLMFGRRS